jgi:hypothetical protein
MKKLLEELAKNFDMAPPATPHAINNAETFFSLNFPADYNEFLLFANGLEGEIDDKYLVLWSVEELVELNQAYNVKEFVSNIIIIGSDGAEDAFAFDTTNMNIIRLPFIGMGHITGEKISETFRDFLSSHIKQRESFFKQLFGRH